jgi:hypothetical protein
MTVLQLQMIENGDTMYIFAHIIFFSILLRSTIIILYKDYIYWFSMVFLFYRMINFSVIRLNRIDDRDKYFFNMILFECAKVIII